MDSEAGPTSQADDSPVIGESSAEPPFSELISRWLAEGDQLAATPVAADTGGPRSAIAKRWAPRLERLREITDRHRVLVLAGLGLIPMALFVLTHRSAAPPPVAIAVAAPPPVAIAVAPPAPPPVVRVAALIPPAPAARASVMTPLPPAAVVSKPAVHSVRKPARVASGARHHVAKRRRAHLPIAKRSSGESRSPRAR